MEDSVLLIPNSSLPTYPTLKESWAALGWLVLGSLVVGIIFISLQKLLAPTSGWAKVGAGLLASEAGVLLTCWWLRRRAGAARWPGFSQAEFAVRWSWLVPGLVLATDGLLTAISLLHLPDWTTQRYLEMGHYPALALVLGGLASPVVEELLFRGILLKGLLRNYRPWVAIAQSALLFGLVHASPAHSLSAALLGAMLGWLYYRTRSLGMCIAFHSFNNLLAFLAMQRPHLRQDVTIVQTLGWARYGGVLLASALVLAASLWALGRLVAPMPSVPAAAGLAEPEAEKLARLMPGEL